MSPCPLVRGAIFTFRHQNGHTAVDIVESLSPVDPFITSTRHGKLHRENLTRRTVIFTDDRQAHPGDKILFNGLLYTCEETFDMKYHAVIKKQKVILPHYKSHRVVCTTKELTHIPNVDDLWEMFWDYSIGKVDFRISEIGHKRYKLNKRVK